MRVTAIIRSGAWFLCSGLVLAFAITAGYPAYGRAAGISLTTSPVVLNLPIRPGTAETRALQLMNNSAEPLKIDMRLDVFGAKGNSGDATITEPLPNDPSPKWVSFSPSSFIAKPGVWSPVKMTINLPTSASLGYYFAVLFKPDIAGLPSAQTTLIRGTNAILVLVDTHTGNESRTLGISDFNVSQGLYEYLPATFNIRVHNGGNIYVEPTGNVYVSRNSDLTDTIAALDVNPGEGNVLPGTDRIFQVRWADGFPMYVDKQENGQTVRDVQGKPEQQLSWSFARFNKIRFGKYYAKVTVIYNDGTRTIPLSRVVSFWVIPWRLLLILLGALVVLVVGLGTIIRFVVSVPRRARVYRR